MNTHKPKKSTVVKALKDAGLPSDIWYCREWCSWVIGGDETTYWPDRVLNIPRIDDCSVEQWVWAVRTLSEASR